ncbi:hypothetical protein N7508_011229 [Penicillium antarcticum]|uniref:uncharacterized protein n=1 Tax=Penicillium antarcticum TaxID=416450 RepID=UPI002398C7A6|nr:uncharacterized protein N7508_011229 [Penicillium antarcticum]KAJ5288454.1 hypothetical protein N7508_011229 [Penicillium antarcticum]
MNVTGCSCLTHIWAVGPPIVGSGRAHDPYGPAHGPQTRAQPPTQYRPWVVPRSSYNHCCENIGFIGLSGYGGGMSKKIVAPAGHFYPIPENVSSEAASFIELLAVAWHSVKISLFEPGNSVLIVGGGTIGLGLLQVLKLQGAKNIIVAELMDSRKDLCLYYGATHIIDPRNTNFAQQTRHLTDGVGANIIFDTAGVEKALLIAIPACRTQGKIVNIAVWEKRPSFPVNQLMYNEVWYVGAALYDEVSFLETIQALSKGHLNSEAMITARICLDEIVEKGFQALLEHRDHHCKILVDVQS